MSADQAETLRWNALTDAQKEAESKAWWIDTTQGVNGPIVTWDRGTDA